MVSRRGMVVRLAGVEAMDDGVQQFLLQPPCDLGARDQSSFGFREMAGLPDQALEFRCFRARRTEYPARQPWCDRLSGQCLAATPEVLGR